MVDFAVVPARTALINVDLQNCFVHGYPISAPDGLLVLERVNRLAAACRRAGVLVIHASVVMRPDGSNLGILGEFSQPVKEGILNKGSESAALHKELVIDPRDILLDKPRFGAFHGTDLELILRARGIDTVIVSGVATNICCETTARERPCGISVFSSSAMGPPHPPWAISRPRNCKKQRAPRLAFCSPRCSPSTG